MNLWTYWYRNPDIWRVSYVRDPSFYPKVLSLRCLRFNSRPCDDSDERSRLFRSISATSLGISAVLSELAKVACHICCAFVLSDRFSWSIVAVRKGSRASAAEELKGPPQRDWTSVNPLSAT